jgi:DNA-binding NarL/FixJ family response regulator
MDLPYKVLVVDDEPHIRTYVSMLVRDTLTESTVVQAGDEAGAMAQFAATKPDLVMLDINLIGSSGLDVLEKIRQLDPAVVIIMLTAVNVRHVVEEAMAKGANGYILKESTNEEMADAGNSRGAKCRRATTGHPMSAPPAKTLSSAQPALQEERYSLRDMLAAVALESHAGAIGGEKLHQKDAQKIFRAKPKLRRVAQS